MKKIMNGKLMFLAALTSLSLYSNEVNAHELNRQDIIVSDIDVTNLLIANGDPYNINQMRKDLNKLPEYAKDMIKDFTITVYDDDYGIENNLGWSAYGTTNVAKKKMYIESVCYDEIVEYYQEQGYNTFGMDDYSLSYNMVKNVMYHEVGHVVDANFGYCSFEPEFASIYSQENYSLSSTDYYNITYNSDRACVKNAEEYFATCYALYFTNTSLLQSVCPQTYAYIQKVELNYKNSHGYNNTATNPTDNTKDTPKPDETPKTDNNTKTDETPKTDNNTKTDETPKADNNTKKDETPKTDNKKVDSVEAKKEENAKLNLKFSDKYYQYFDLYGKRIEKYLVRSHENDSNTKTNKKSGIILGYNDFDNYSKEELVAMRESFDNVNTEVKVKKI